MKTFKRILLAGLAAIVATSCTSAFYSSSGSAYDDLYAIHDRTAIANRQKAEAEAAQLLRERFSSAEARSRLENENRRLQRENDAQRRFMETVKDREGRSMLEAYEARKATQKRGQEWSR